MVGIYVALIVMSIAIAGAQISSKRSVYGSIIMILVFCIEAEDRESGTYMTLPSDSSTVL